PQAGEGDKEKRRLFAGVSLYFSIRNSSTWRPSAVYAASQRGWRPRPVQVFSGLAGSRYFGGTLPSLRAFLATPRVVRAGAAAPVPNSSSMEYPSVLACWVSLRRTWAIGLRLAKEVLRFLAL